MGDTNTLLLAYARLERKRRGEGLDVKELERWNFLKHRLNRHFSPGLDAQHSEQRQSVRVPTYLNCSFESFGSFERALITNLSSSGVFINTVSPLPIGTELRMRIRVAGSGAQIELSGEVVSNNIGPSFDTLKVGMGVRFSAGNPEIVKKIHDLYVQVIQSAADDAKEQRKATEKKPQRT